MTTNLVIVESPAKAKTIERYLGPGYTVLASYGHVRDLPENPGKGQLGVDVDHDFAPDYEIPADRRKQVAAIEKAARGGRPRLPRHRPRPRGRGDRLARRRGGPPRAGADTAGSPSARSPRARSGRPSPHPARSTWTWSMPSRRAGSSTGWSATRSARCSGARFARACRPAASSRSPSASWSTANGRSGRSRPASTGPRGHAPGAGRRRRSTAELVRIDGQQPADRRRGDRRGATSRPSAPAAPSSVASRSSHPSAARRRRSRPRTLQQEASRKLGFSPKRTMSVAQRLYEGVETPDGQVGLITYMRTDSVALVGPGDGRGAGRHRMRATGRPTTMPKGRRYRTKTRNAQEAHEAIRPTSLRSRPGGAGRLARPRRGAPLPADLAARARQPDGREGARDDDRRARGRGGTTCARRRPGRSSTASAASTPRAATRAEEEAERTLPPLAEGDVDQGRRGPADPALHRAAAALHRGDPHQGARGARDRPAVDLRRHDLHDRRSRLRHGPGAPPPPGAGRRDRHRPARGALRRVRGSRVHGPHGGGARRGRPRRARLGPAAARVLRAASRRSSTRSGRSSGGGLHHRRDRRGLLAGPPDGHPARPQRAVPGLLALPRAQGVAAAARARSRTCRRCPGSASPARPAARRTAACWRSSAAGSGRSSAAPATRTATTSRRTARRRRTSCRSR